MADLLLSKKEIKVKAKKPVQLKICQQKGHMLRIDCNLVPALASFVLSLNLQ